MTDVPKILKGKVALVTGASRGIGAAVAKRLASAGASVAISARTLDEGDAKLPGSLRTTLSSVEDEGSRGFYVIADLADEEDRARIVPEVEAALGPIDILVNNAAAAMYAPAAEIPTRRRRLLFELNVHAPVDLMQAVLPSMRTRGQGWIVNLTSATGTLANSQASSAIGATAYGASKAALERYSRGLAAEVVGSGVAVNLVAPVAAVKTEGAVALLGELLDNLGPDLLESVEDLAEAVAQLCWCDPAECSGRIFTSREILADLPG